MANVFGIKGNKGGSMARKQFISMDYGALTDLVERLRAVEADVEQVVADAMEKAAEKVQRDTVKALEDVHLPAKGAHHGKNRNTEASVVRDIKPTVTRQYVEVRLGFDKTKPGAGGFLITGTPKMNPDKALVKIYGSKQYQREITEEIRQELDKAIKERMEN